MIESNFNKAKSKKSMNEKNDGFWKPKETHINN